MNQEEKEYKEMIAATISEEYAVAPEHANKMMEKINFDELFDRTPEAVFYYSPEYWAERVYEIDKKEEE